MRKLLLLFCFSFFLTSCTSEDFQNCTDYSSQILQLNQIIEFFRGTTVITLYGLIYTFTIFRKIL